MATVLTTHVGMHYHYTPTPEGWMEGRKTGVSTQSVLDVAYTDMERMLLNDKKLFFSTY